MEQIKNSGGEDDAATDKEEAKGVWEKEQTEDEAETPTGSPALSAAVNPHVTPTPPRKEERKEVEKEEQHPLKRSSGSIHKILSQDTFTAWEKRRPSKEGSRGRPPRFSRLLSSLSEEQMASQQKSELPTEPPEEELEDLVRRPSLQEHPSGQNMGMPVNLSALSLPQPREIPAVETVEMEPKGLEDQVPSTSEHAEDPTVPSAHSSIELKKEDSSCVPLRRLATVHSVHSKVLLPEDSGSSIPDQSRKDTLPCVWNMGQRISRWKLAHQRGYHIDQLTQDKTLKSTIMKHERDTKAAVPLPLQEVMEEEALEILKETLKDYHKYLGVDHHLTQQLEEQAEKLHLRLKGRGVID